MPSQRQHVELSTHICREQYQDLISAADAIITMSKNAQAIQSNFERMQHACDVDRIQQTSKKTLRLRDEKSNQSKHACKQDRHLPFLSCPFVAHIDTKRKYIHVIAALVKSLADVPEQIWHALENHRYLHASRLYTLAKQVHDYLEQEKERSTIDIEVAFPVIQRQWDAVSAFGPQIIQRSTHYLRVSEQSTEVWIRTMCVCANADSNEPCVYIAYCRGHGSAHAFRRPNIHTIHQQIARDEIQCHPRYFAALYQNNRQRQPPHHASVERGVLDHQAHTHASV